MSAADYEDFYVFVNCAAENSDKNRKQDFKVDVPTPRQRDGDWEVSLFEVVTSGVHGGEKSVLVCCDRIHDSSLVVSRYHRTGTPTTSGVLLKHVLRSVLLNNASTVYHSEVFHAVTLDSSLPLEIYAIDNQTGVPLTCCFDVMTCTLHFRRRIKQT